MSIKSNRTILRQGSQPISTKPMQLMEDAGMLAYPPEGKLGPVTGLDKEIKIENYAEYA